MSNKQGRAFMTLPSGVLAASWLIVSVALSTESAQAQSASSTFSSYRTGYGGAGAGLSGLESPVNLSLISAGSQFAISDGVNEAGAVGSVFEVQTSSDQTSSSQASNSQGSNGANPSYAGVGQLASSNERAPAAVVDTAARSRRSAPAASSQNGETTGTAASAPAEGSAPNDLVLNGKINLDGNP